MNIFEFVSFDFMDWITKPYGIFITAGIVLLLIAIILLLTDKKGDKVKESKEVTSENTGVDTVVNNQPSGVVEPNNINVATAGIEQPSQINVPTQVVVPNVSTAPVQSQEVQVASVESVAQTPVQPVVETTVQPEVPVSVEPSVQVTSPVVTEPVVSVEQPIPSNNVIADNVATNVVSPINSVQQNVMPETPVNEIPAVSIYGGVSPTPDVSKINSEEKHEIYGGANPLENTTSIPNVQNSIYNGSVSNIDTLQNNVPVSNIVDVPVTQNVVSPSIEQPVNTVLNSIPTPIEQPSINPVPVNEPSIVVEQAVPSVTSSDIEEL